MGDEALAPKRDGAVSAVAGFDPKATFVHEMHCGELIQHAAARAATFTMDPTARCGNRSAVLEAGMSSVEIDAGSNANECVKSWCQPRPKTPTQLMR